MSAVQATATGTDVHSEVSGDNDKAEVVLRSIDGATKGSTGIGLFHIMTIGAIGASIALFLSGKKDAGIFVGLWAPTFQALRAATEESKRSAS